MESISPSKLGSVDLWEEQSLHVQLPSFHSLGLGVL